VLFSRRKQESKDAQSGAILMRRKANYACNLSIIKKDDRPTGSEIKAYWLIDQWHGNDD